MALNDLIYADNAATTRLDHLALESMMPFLTDVYSNPSSIHTFGKKAKSAIENARQQIADCIGASPEEILFTSCGTESNNWAVKGTAHLYRSEDIHIISSLIEHHAVLKSLVTLENEGCRTSLLPVDSHGLLSIDDLISAISPSTRLISIIMANNEIGTIQYIKQIASIARQYSITFHTDAVQAVGHTPVNVVNLGVDLLSASAHKFNGPKGIGFLYKRSEVSLPCLLDGGHQEFGLRAGTEHVAAIVGMACALKNNIDNLNANINHIEHLASILSSRIFASIPNVILNGHPTQRLPGLLSLSFAGISGESLLHLLDLKGICISTGAACNSQDTVISHVLKALKGSDSDSSGTIRISLSKDNTDEEAVFIADTIVGLYHKLYR